jgi:hypothetical protein
MSKHRVFMPAEMLADYREIHSKHQASRAMGKAGTNYEAALASFLSMSHSSANWTSTDPAYKDALLVFGSLILSGESQYRREDGCFNRSWSGQRETVFQLLKAGEPTPMLIGDKLYGDADDVDHPLKKTTSSYGGCDGSESILQAAKGIEKRTAEATEPSPNNAPTQEEMMDLQVDAVMAYLADWAMSTSPETTESDPPLPWDPCGLYQPDEEAPPTIPFDRALHSALHGSAGYWDPIGLYQFDEEASPKQEIQTDPGEDLLINKMKRTIKKELIRANQGSMAPAQQSMQGSSSGTSQQSGASLGGAVENPFRIGTGVDLSGNNNPQVGGPPTEPPDTSAHSESNVHASGKTATHPEQKKATQPSSTRTTYEKVMDPLFSDSTIVGAVQSKIRLLEQEAAFVEGSKILSEINLTKDSTTLHRGNPQAASFECGVREALSRFPHMTGDKAFFFSAHPQNITAAEYLRNQDIGDYKPWKSEMETKDRIVKWFCDNIFTYDQCQAAAREIGTTFQNLPGKFTDKDRQEMVMKSMTETLDLEHVFKVNCKPEVSAKDKPRSVVDHGARRLTAVAHIAAVFDYVVFHRLKYASIKGRSKRQALSEICTNMNALKSGTVIENDLTAFEYGIGYDLKKAEADILRHIARQIGNLEASEIDSMEFERVVDEREMICKWKFTFTAQDGSKQSIKLKLSRVIRESGDRLTSSGNWLQNVIGWFTFLVKTDEVEKALQAWFNHGGKYFTYVSARDGEVYKAVLAFEGDDTIGRLLENVRTHVELFFTRWGWKPKLKYFDSEGAVTFVGYQMLFKNSAFQFEMRPNNQLDCLPDPPSSKFASGKSGWRDALCKPPETSQIVCFPELKRCLKTKQWSTTQLRGADYANSVEVYAKLMTDEFNGLQPMHTFFSSLAADCKDRKGWANVFAAEEGTTFPSLMNLGRKYGGLGKGKCIQDDALVKDVALKKFGACTHKHLNCAAKVLENLQVAPCVPSKLQEDLARLSAGDWTNVEWSNACSLTSLSMHGPELRALFISSWVTG